MAENEKIIELITRLRGAFPNKYINIDKRFDAHAHDFSSNRIEISFRIYIQHADTTLPNSIHGIPALEACVDMIILNEASKPENCPVTDKPAPVCSCKYPKFSYLHCDGFVCGNCGRKIHD